MRKKNNNNKTSKTVRFVWLAVFLWFAGSLKPIPLIAQIQLDSNTVRHESMRQGINTISFGTELDFRRSLRKGPHFSTRAGQFAVYNRAITENPFITNNLWAHVKYKRPVSRFFAWENEAFQQSYLANKTRIAQLLSGFSFFRPTGKHTVLHVQGTAGLVNDKRSQFENSGWKTEVYAGLAGLSPDSGISYKTALKWTQSQPLPRKNQRILAQAEAERSFSGGGLMGAQIAYLSNQVEDYLLRDIQSIRSDTLQAKVRLRIPLGKSFTFQTDNEYLTPNRTFFYLNRESRNEIRNVRYFQDEFLSLSSLLLRKKRLQFQFSFESRLRNRTYDIINRLDPGSPLYLQQLNQFNQRLNEERIKDIQEQYSTYVLDLRLRIHRSHSLRASFTGQLLRVDTRSDQNNQDRDEVLYAGEMAHDWNFPFGFRLSNKFSTSFRHLIFIKASQSSENYTDRIIRWEPSLRWSGKNLSWIGNMGIWATYQVRDFESQQDKNRSNRVLILQHQIDYRLSTKAGLVTEMLRRENRLSQFSWKNFSESPIDTIIIHDLALRFRYQFKAFALQAGYRAFWQTRKSKASLPEPGTGASLIYLKSYFVQQGPQIRFIREGKGRLNIQGEIWLQWTSQFFTYSKSNIPYLANPMSPAQLDSKENRFLPFFNLQASWLLGKNP